MGMSISSSTAVQGNSQAWQQRQQNVQALSQALSSNNLDSAKAAYASMTSNGASSAASNPDSPLAQVGQALENGDLASAQKAFSQMTAGHHGHHGHGGTGSTASAPVSTPTVTTGNNVNVYA